MTTSSGSPWLVELLELDELEPELESELDLDRSRKVTVLPSSDVSLITGVR